MATDQELQDTLEKTLQVTTPLAEMSTEYDDEFLNVLAGVYRISFSTLRDIYYLSQLEGTGSSALDLARKIMEYGISVEYMIWKGKNKKSKQFQKFIAVEFHKTFEFLKAINQDVLRENEILKEGYEYYENEYLLLASDIRKRINWAGLSVDKMLEQLRKSKTINGFDFSRIGEAYVWCSRLNHVSPFVVKNIMEKDTAEIASKFYLRQAIVFALVFHFRLSTRYIDEIRLLSNDNNKHTELAESVTKLRDKFNRLRA